jgi:hypothetical protein
MSPFIQSIANSRHVHTTLFRRFVDRLLLLRRSFKGATNNRRHAPLHGHSPRATQGLLRYSDPDPVRQFGLHHLLLWERSPTGSREEMLRAVSSSARTAYPGSQESSSRRLRPPSMFRGGVISCLVAVPLTRFHLREVFNAQEQYKSRSFLSQAAVDSLLF